ncbi:MAG: NAD-dependent epimerase/dehydratase family protein [Bacteroidota bacterium]
MKTVLVTGANGLLASNIIAELLAKGYSVKGLLRNCNNFQLKAHPNLELAQGDIVDKECIKNALKDCSCVIHVAAITEQSLLHYSDYSSVNVDATEALIRAAAINEIETFVYVSSANTFGYGLNENRENETIEMKAPFTKSHYAKSKFEGQQIALSYKDKMKVVVVNPTFMLGTYDSKPSSGEIILMGYKKKIIFYPSGGKNFVHVQDAAKGTVNAMKFGKSGESYILANENLSYKSFFQKLSTTTYNNPIYIMIPKYLLLLIGLFGSIIRKLGIKTSISLTNMRILCINNFYNNHKAKRDLKLRFQSTEKAISDSLDWFVEREIIAK